LDAALADTRVVLLNGARQVGKSTLAQQLAQQRGRQCLTLDDPAIAALARSDPSAPIDGMAAFTVIDEVQSAPALFPALKREVDRHPVPVARVLCCAGTLHSVICDENNIGGRRQPPLFQSAA